MNVKELIAKELTINATQVASVIKLLDEGATVPFIARYRKEATGGLDDTQLRLLSERLVYLRELNARREVILQSITEQGKLTDALKKQLNTADTKSRLEDLYLPYKKKRRTKAQIAREAGLEPLAEALFNGVDLDPHECAKAYINMDKGIEDSKAALDGARQILMERFSEHADLIAQLRQHTYLHALMTSQVKKEKEKEGVKFKDYYDFSEAVAKIAHHRVLALFRGQKEDFLRLAIEFADEQGDQECIQSIADTFGVVNDKSACGTWLWQVVEWTWKIKLKLKIDVDIMMQLRNEAEESAITVFKENLSNLLLSAPAGKKVTMALDPGFRTGVKVVVVSDTGKLLDHTVIYPHAPQKQWQQALVVLEKLCKTYNVDLVSIGNGTASRETDKLVSDLKKSHNLGALTSIVVSEAGASVYSASKLAAEEFPSLDVSYRGAVSIARRLQDPLAELVKIDPKSIGVGQYQHDVNQVKLGAGLNQVLEDCVNAVGADVNTASVPLLKSISGLTESAATGIVNFRETNGRFQNRESIRKVVGIGDKTFQQAAGFLRIVGGDNPLDISAVHPEAYHVVDRILEKNNIAVTDIMGNSALIDSLSVKDYVCDNFGQETVRDVLSELKKPGRDPRPEFKTASFDDDINTVSDLKVGMKLEGVVTNVTNFGAFVDIGVHQDGLVHVSQISNTFVKDVHEVIKVGQIVNVEVVNLDLDRSRIGLSMKSLQGEKSNNKERSKHQNRTQVKNKLEKGGFADLLQSAIRS